jgi:hypothetical protein
VCVGRQGVGYILPQIAFHVALKANAVPLFEPKAKS